MLTDYPSQEETIDFQLRKMFSDTSLVTEISLPDSGDIIFIWLQIKPEISFIDLHFIEPESDLKT